MIYKKGDNMKEIFIDLLFIAGVLGMLIGSVVTHYVMLLIGYKKER